MKKIIIITQLVLVCFLFNSPGYAQSNVDAYIAELKDENKKVRANAADELGYLKDERAVAPLLAVLKDVDERRLVQAAAANALGELNDKSAVVLFIAALKDENRRVRGNAANVLGYLKDKSAVVPLIAVLKDKENSIHFRGLAATALGNLEDERAVAPLTSVLTETSTNAAGMSAKSVYKIRHPVRAALAKLSDM